MAGFTYIQLKDAVMQWCGEDNLDSLGSKFDYILTAAQTRVQRDLELDIFIGQQNGVFTAGQNTISAPSDMLEVASFYYTSNNTRYPILKRAYGWIVDYEPDTSVTGAPKYWAVDDDNSIILSPTPNSGFSYFLRYHQRISNLSSSNTTNWISVNVPDLLLFACLEESEIFLHESQQGRVGMWQGKYDRILPSVRSEIALLSKTGTERLTLTPLLLPPLEVSDERTA
jgi:hypothetical protein